MDKTEVISKLNSGIYELEFTKLDGSIRQMLGTRDLGRIPEDKHPGSGVVREMGEIAPVAVFDLQACGWRSVYPDKISKFVEASIGAELHYEVNEVNN